MTSLGSVLVLPRLAARPAADPVLTVYTDAGRVELSVQTLANGVAKNANLLIDGLGGPPRVAVLLAPGWQALTALLAALASGAQCLAGPDDAGLAALDADDAVYLPVGAPAPPGPAQQIAVSAHPLGMPEPGVLRGQLDHAREVGGYGDSFAPVGPPGVLVGPHGRLPLDALPDLPDRVLVPDAGRAADLPVLLRVLASGSALVLGPLSHAAAERAEPRQLSTLQ